MLNEVSEINDYKDNDDEKDQTIKRLQQELNFKDELIAVLAEKLSALEMISKNSHLIPDSGGSAESLIEKPYARENV